MMIKYNILKSVSTYLCSFLYSIVLLSIPVIGNAQINELKFSTISVDQGLSQNTIGGIVQDKYGFLWIGTQDGLNRYDGYTFKTFKHNPLDSSSISDSYILCLFKDSKENIWIGTELGINKYDYEKESFEKCNCKKGEENKLIHNYISVIYEAKSKPGTLWIGTKLGLNSYDIKSKTFTRYELPFSDILNQNNYLINAIYETPSEPGILWMGTPVGLLRYSIEKKSFTLYTKKQGLNSISDNFVNIILEDSHQDLWIGTSRGLNILNRSNGHFTTFYNDPKDKYSLGHNNINTIFEDSNNNLWIGTWGSGLNLFVRNKKQFLRWTHEPGNPNSISNNDITHIIEDNSGILWFGTQVGGLNKVIPNAKKIAHYNHNPNDPNSLIYPSVRSIIEDKNGLLWIGTDDGISCLNKKNNTFTHYRHDPNNINSLNDNQVRVVRQARDGIFWFGTKFGGLNKFDPVRKTFKHYTPDIHNRNSINSVYIRTIFEDKNGIIWIGTINGGLSRFDPKTEVFKNYLHEPDKPASLNDNRVYSIISAEEGMLWLGTGSGIAKFDPKSELFIKYNAEPENPNGLSHHLIMSLFEDHAGMIWVGTYGGGLNMMDPKTGKFSRYTENEGLPNNAVYGVVEDNNYNLWLSTNRGISVFNPKTEAFKNYGIEDGLQNYEFNSGAYYKDKEGNIYFGGINGLNVLNPDSIGENQFIPPVVIHEFQLFNKPVKPCDTKNEKPILTKSILETKHIELSYRENVLSFSFASLDYTFPEKNKYAYILENFDSDWNELSDRRFVSYTSLDAGEYIFRVKGSNSDGKWNNEDRSIKIVIKPPFWKTWWFKTLGSIVLMLTVYLLIKVRTRNIKIQNKKLEQMVESRTEALYTANVQLLEKQTDLEIKQEEILAQRDSIENQNIELEKHRNRLDQLVIERTSELEAALKKAQEADQLKSAFLANMSHEIRTPMNAIIGFSDLITDPSLNQTEKDDLSNRIAQNCDSLLRLIDDIIDLAKIEAGQLIIEKSEFNVVDTLNELITVYIHKKITMNKTQVEFKINIDNTQKDIQLFTDKIRVRQVLINLLDNALKFTEKGFIEFGYTTTKTHVNFFVQDTGIGLSREQTKEIFNRFRKFENYKKGLYRGAGLGLAISKNIVELLGGEIWVESEVGKGSKFQFTIPRQ